MDVYSGRTRRSASRPGCGRNRTISCKFQNRGPRDPARGSAAEHMIRSSRASAVVAALVAAVAVSLHGQQQTDTPGFKFRSGVELINVTATVTDVNGRFVPGLKAEDFSVFEDEKPVEVTQFSADRVPVSLGLLLDTSQSMAGEKFDAARSAIDRFLYDLNSPDD